MKVCFPFIWICKNPKFYWFYIIKPEYQSVFPTFWLFMFLQVKESNGPKPYLFIILNLTIGLSCALPAYLYAKEAN